MTITKIHALRTETQTDKSNDQTLSGGTYRKKKAHCYKIRKSKRKINRESKYLSSVWLNFITLTKSTHRQFLCSCLKPDDSVSRSSCLILENKLLRVNRHGTVSCAGTEVQKEKQKQKKQCTVRYTKDNQHYINTSGV